MIKTFNVTYLVMISEIVCDPHFCPGPDKLFTSCEDEKTAQTIADKWNNDHKDAWAKAWVKESMTEVTAPTASGYTEADLRKWFAWMRQNYQNSPSCLYYSHVEDAMFNPLHEKESLENFKKGLDKPTDL